MATFSCKHPFSLPLLVHCTFLGALPPLTVDEQKGVKQWQDCLLRFLRPHVHARYKQNEDPLLKTLLRSATSGQNTHMVSEV